MDESTCPVLVSLPTPPTNKQATINERASELSLAFACERAAKRARAERQASNRLLFLTVY